MQTFEERGLNKNDVSAVADIIARSSRFHVVPAKAVPLILSLPAPGRVYPSPSQKTPVFPPDWEAKAARPPTPSQPSNLSGVRAV